MTTPREDFLAVVYNGPIYPADAIIVLMGEDAVPRVRTAAQLFASSPDGTVIVCTGALSGDGKLNAEQGAAKLLGLGVAPDRVIVEPMATNTVEQVKWVVDLAITNAWKRLLVVASPYHVPRAILTFVKELRLEGKDDEIEVMPVPTAHTPWWGFPEAAPTMSRLALLGVEMEKIDRYANDVATFEDGLAYFAWWEGKNLG